jgi:hypothetical protein
MYLPVVAGRTKICRFSVKISNPSPETTVSKNYSEQLLRSLRNNLSQEHVSSMSIPKIPLIQLSSYLSKAAHLPAYSAVSQAAHL